MKNKKLEHQPDWIKGLLAKAALLPPQSLCMEPSHPVFISDTLKSLWDPQYIPPQYSLGKPDWLLAMTSAFLKDVASIDRKMQGRILEAIGQILRAPTTPQGDTVKPLTGNLQGMWRYRVGEYRLVYLPRENTHEVHLIGFTSRGAAYD